MSARDAGSLFADSMITRVAGILAMVARTLRRAADFGGRKPKKKNRSVGIPEITRALSTEDAPGRGVMAIPSAKQAHTSLYPGSDTRGVPASDTNATVRPFFRRLISFGPAFSALCS